MDRRELIGLAMRLYRRSPFHPHLGKVLAQLLGRMTRGSSKLVIHEVHGVRFELDLSEVIDASLYYSGSFEPKAEAVIENGVKPGMIAVDVGANVGYHTFRLARLVGPDGRVLAIEPTERAFARLQRNAALNAFTNIAFLRAGLAERELGPTEVAFQSSYRLDDAQQSSRELVRLTSLDVLVAEQGLPRVDFLKVDVDGFEARVFAGASDSLRRFRPLILFEFTPRAIAENADDPHELLQSLRNLNYELAHEDGAPASDLAALSAGGAVNLVARQISPADSRG